MPLIGLAVFVAVVAALAWWVARAETFFWTRLAAAGFLLIPLATAVQAAAGNLVGVLGGPLPLVIAALVVGVVVVAMKRFHMAAFVLALFLTLVFLVFGLFGLTHPDSFGDFGPSVLSIAGAVLAAVGSAKARSEQKRDVVTGASAIRRNSVWTAAAVLALIGATSAAQTVFRPASGAVAGAQIVRMEQDAFEPTVLRARAGTRKTVFVRNDDAYAHTFTIDEASVDVYIGPLRAKRVSFSVPKGVAKGAGPSSIDFVCTVTGHDDMRGRLEIEN